MSMNEIEEKLQEMIDTVNSEIRKNRRVVELYEEDADSMFIEGKVDGVNRTREGSC